jgi:N-acetylneuraminate lyase
MNFRHFEGLIAATFTPFDTKGELNLDIIPEYARRLKEDGVKGVFVCGSSGEGLLVENGERKAVAEAWIAFSEEDFRVIVDVGSTSSNMAGDLAAHAASIGADAVGCMGPCCFQPRDARSLTAFCAEVASAAPKMPFYYYHIPGTSGVHVKMDEFLNEAATVIPIWPELNIPSPT